MAGITQNHRADDPQARPCNLSVLGPDLNIVYNDAYRPFLGLKEEGALGKPFHIIWSDVWNDVKPFVDQALSGKGTFAEDMHLVMDRNGYPKTPTGPFPTARFTTTVARSQG